jgi:hypothetical protein
MTTVAATLKTAQSSTMTMRQQCVTPADTRGRLATSMSEAAHDQLGLLPESSPPPEFGLFVVALFEEMADAIDSTKRVDQPSDAVMGRLRPGLEKLGFRVEKGKSSEIR